MDAQRKLQAVGDLELLEHGLEVGLDGAFGDAEGVGDGEVAVADGGPLGDFPLPLGEGRAPVGQASARDQCSVVPDDTGLLTRESA